MKIKMTFLLIGTIGFLRNLFAARSAIRQKSHENQTQLLNSLYAELAQRTGRSSAQAAAWYTGAFLPAFVKLLERAEARPGLVSLLEQLRRNELKLAVVSDFDWVQPRLEALKIPPYLFDTLRCSEEFGVLKPNPGPFLEVAREWQISPENVLVVGDRADRDGEGAANAGMPFLGIADKQTERAEFYCWNDALAQIRARTNCGASL